MIALLMTAVACLTGAAPEGPPPADAGYEAQKAATSRDAGSQVRLALWCESHGMERERIKHLAIAVLTDPSNAMARGLMGLVDYKGKWMRPEKVAEVTVIDVAHADLLAEYNGRRVKTPVAAGPQFKLAQWCEEKGLKEEARAHLATVVRLDPNHAEAWKKLGYKKVGSRWVTDAQIVAAKADHESQQKADKEWKPKLEHLREALTSKNSSKHEEALRTMGAITDPRAVPRVWTTFVSKGVPQQLAAVQILGQIDAIDASRGLALIALNTTSDEVRRRATETLRRRDPREWGDIPVSMIREKIKYTSKPVGGPNDPGELNIAGKSANFKRIYRPGAAFQLQPGDRIVQNNQGQPILVRMGEVFRVTGGTLALGRAIARYDLGYLAESPLSSPEAFQTAMNTDVPPTYYYPNPFVPYTITSEDPSRSAARMQQTLGHGNPLAGPAIQLINDQRALARFYSIDETVARDTNNLVARANLDQGPVNGEFSRMTVTAVRTTTYSVARLLKDARNSAIAAAEQLKGDVAILDSTNEQTARANANAVALLSNATGQSFGDDRMAWENWFVNQIGYAAKSSDDSKPTIIENVPVAYQPTALLTSAIGELKLERLSCFGKGTLVRTVSGPRPIEQLNVGDQVLSQDMKTGKLGYRPILVVHRNPPSATYKIAIDDQAVVSSHFHRFWKAGHGWVMARDLKVGDPIRTLGGVGKVTAIEPDQVQFVFNLDVADDADFFAGNIAALVHDNTLPDLKQVPFDSARVGVAK